MITANNEQIVSFISKHKTNQDLRPFVFLRDGVFPYGELYERLLLCKRAGIGGIIPLDRTDSQGEDAAERLNRFRDFYSLLLPVAKELGLKVAFSLVECVEGAVVLAEDALWEDNMRSRKLVYHTHYCEPEEDVEIELYPGKLLSLIAYNERYDEIIDLRGNIEDGEILRFSTPRGNWSIVEYLSVPDNDEDRPDLLSLEASEKYLDAAFSLFADIITPYLGTTVTHLYCSGIGFEAVNRHDWSDGFNEVFMARYGFDPAQYYPYLFSHNGKDSYRYKALFADCRARMLRDGFFRAAENFVQKHGLALFATIAEPKLTQCSPITGDALLDNTASPAAVLNKSYLYGLNSVKIAAGAAFGRSIRDIFVELYDGYLDAPHETLMRDISHAFARGANLPAMHLPEANDLNGESFSKLLRYAVTVRSALCRGRQVCDIAVIYPIYYLHSCINMYSAQIHGFEYPDTPTDADYMSVINTLCLFAGHDATLLHPDVIARSAQSEGDVLRLAGMSDEGGFKVVILPSQKVTSLACMRVLREYFDNGGRIIATGNVPSYAFEYDHKNPDAYDREVREISRHIFGDDAVNPAVMREYCHNVGASGGEAYFLYFSKTGIDGVSMVDSAEIAQVLSEFAVPYDVFAPKMPRYRATGAMNATYKEFTRLGLQKHLPDGGMFSHIHKRDGDTDIYFFTNTTYSSAKTPVFIKGAHIPLCLDPETGGKWKEKYQYVSVCGAVYTRFQISLRPMASVIVISENADERETSINISELPDKTDEALAR